MKTEVVIEISSSVIIKTSKSFCKEEIIGKGSHV